MKIHKRAIRIVGSYLELLADLDPRITPGIMRLYTLRASAGITMGETHTIEQLLDEMVDKEQELRTFQQASIIENCVTYSRMLSAMVAERLKNRHSLLKNESVTDYDRQKWQHLSPACVDALLRVCNMIDTSTDESYLRLENDRLIDVLDAAAKTFTYAALDMRDSVTGSTPREIGMISRALRTFTSTLSMPLIEYTDVPHAYRRYHIPILQILRAMTATYSDIALADVRRTYVRAPIDHTVRIADGTLAALPIPSIGMIRACGDPDAATLSRKGLNYLQDVSASLYIGSAP